MDFMFFLNSALLGAGLAMDAFSVSIVNALAEPDMRPQRRCAVAGVYALFQFAMPMIGWVCVHTVASLFRSFQRLVPWIALALLLAIGGKMLVEAAREGKPARQGRGTDGADRAGEKPPKRLGCPALILQGVATSIDALSVGFTIAAYGPAMAVAASLVIAAVTFAICMGGLLIGRQAGRTLPGRAQLLGGCILVLIGIEIFVRGMTS